MEPLFYLQVELYDFDPLLLAKLQPQIFQSELLYLTASRHGELVDKEDILRYFVARYLADACLLYTSPSPRDRG